MRWTLAAFALLWATLPSFAQVIVGDVVLPKEVSAAKATLAKVKTKLIELNVGEFEVFEPSKTLVSPVLWLLGEKVNLGIVDVAANTTHSVWGKRRGEDKAKTHTFPAQQRPYRIVFGDSPGTLTVPVIANGKDNTEAPFVADTLLFQINGSTPKPDDPIIPPPVEDTLVKKLQADYAADLAKFKADKKWVKALAGLYQMASANDLETVKTIKDLDDLLNSSRQAAGIPDPDMMLLTLRTTLRSKMLEAIGLSDTTANIDGIPLSVDAKRSLKNAFGKFYTALMEVAK
jgi:hypothetical protein